MEPLHYCGGFFKYDSYEKYFFRVVRDSAFLCL